MNAQASSAVSRAFRARNPAARVAAVIGGAGFIGSHLSEALLARGYEVICIDNFQRGSIHDLTGLVGETKGLVVSHDAARPIPDDLPRFDEIYHLAMPPEAPGRHEPVQRIRRARMLLTLFDRAARDGARVLLLAPSGSRDPMGAGPTEALAARIAARRGVNLKIARTAETYGPRMQFDPGGGVGSYLAKTLREESLAGRDDYHQPRSLCFVGDVVEGCLRLMADADAPSLVDIAPSTEVAAAGLVNTIRELAGLGFPTGGSETDGRPACRAGAERLQLMTPLREGLRLTIADLARRLGVSGLTPPA